MGITFEHEVEEFTGESADTVVDIGIGDVVGDMSSGEARDSRSGVLRDDVGHSDKRGVRSTRVGR